MAQYAILSCQKLPLINLFELLVSTFTISASENVLTEASTTQMGKRIIL